MWICENSAISVKLWKLCTENLGRRKCGGGSEYNKLRLCQLLSDSTWNYVVQLAADEKGESLRISLGCFLVNIPLI